MSRPSTSLPLAGRGSIRNLDSKGKRPEAEQKPAGGEGRGGPAGPGRAQKKRALPALNLAPMPKQPQAPAKPKKEEKAQKPIMTLPKDTIRDVKAGGMTAPLLNHLKESAKTKRPGEVKKDAETPPDRAAATGAGAGAGAARGRGKAKPGAEDEDLRELAGMAGARQLRKPSKRSREKDVDVAEDDRGGQQRRRLRQSSSRSVSTAAPRKGKAVIELPCSVRSFSEASGVPTARLLGTLMKMGVSSLNINAQIDEETAGLLAVELGLDVEIKPPETLEDSLLRAIEEQEDDPSLLVPRPPVVTFLGHVDHGKTSLLDAIIGIDVASGEAGGITQHIRAYAVEREGRRVSFVDTPGHEAFTEMRARGGSVSDICVLVVAADDGIMPQTEEAISHARAAEAPIVVALNKMDLPGANENRVMQQLTQYGLVPSEWGGDVEVVRTSAVTKHGIDDLLETLLTIAELHELKANPSRPAIGACLEAEQQSGRGVIAKVMVTNGTLRPGDVIVCGSAYGRVKAMHDTLKPSVLHQEAGPTVPVNITGLSEPPAAGEKFYVLDDIAQAREIAEIRANRSRESRVSGFTKKVSLVEFQRRLQEGDLVAVEGGVVELNLILRADTRGSIEAIRKELDKIQHPEVRVRILQESVGGVTVADVTLASASEAVIIGFNVIPDEAARSMADDRGVEIRQYNIIYKVTEDIKALLEGRLKPEERVVELGRAVVKQVFTISRIGTIAGCHVMAGMIQRGCRIRVYRDNRVIGDYALDSLRHEKDDVREVNRGKECGIKLAGFDDVKEQDVLEAYKIEEVARTL